MRASLPLALLIFPLALTGCPEESGTLGGPVAVVEELEEMSPNPDADTFVNSIPALPEGARSLPVTVGDMGYEPNTLEAQPNETVILDFTRTSKSECGRYVQVMGTETRAELPLNETVKIPVEMPESGTVTFACGMNMMRGIINVVPVELPPDADPADAPAEEKAG